MKYDEFAFLNQQLADMVRDGIPLEGALHRLCAEMRRGALRSELEKLEVDLAKGTPLRQAVRARQLPELYGQMLEIGAQSNDLPAVLTLLADYYQRRHLIWTRLKGLMVYPTIVLFGAFLLSCFLSFLLYTVMQSNMTAFFWDGSHARNILIGLWVSPVLLGLAAVAIIIAITAPPLRRSLRWRLPAFKEASLAQVASAMTLMLKNGVPFDKALTLMEQLEKGTPAETEITQWRQRLAAGRGKFSEMTSGGQIFPPLFVWMVAHSGEDLAAGFQQASEIYQSRATYRTEMLLYSALPCSVLALGLVIIAQIQPVFAVFAALISGLSGGGDM
jgi:type II secretory pathway component PulF